MSLSGEPGDRLVVGLDFGTTFSGVAFTYSANPDPPDGIDVVKNWPGSNNITSDKVPSEISYEATSTSGTKRNLAGEPIGSRDTNIMTVRWGFQLKPEQSRLRCLKLRLDPRQELPHYVSKEDLCEQLRQYGKTHEEAISDYLSKIYDQAKEALVKRFGEQMVSATKIDVVLTVPAVWTDAAKDATLRVAEKAGMGNNLYMISEPEAAAIYALKSMDQKSKLLHAGDNFIVCDAGGGTVDIISYEIRSLSPLRLEESVEGTGALCGGVFLNLRFQELVKSRLGQEAFEDLCRRKPRSWAIALKYFEDYVKRNFDPMDSPVEYDDSKFNVPLPGVEDNATAGIDCGFIILSTADVAEIFRPIVNSVIELVERQRIMLSAYGKTAKGVILVGGFGQSNFLYKSLKSRFADDDPPPMYTQSAKDPAPELNTKFIVMQPTNAWTAVVRGAVLSGLEDKLVMSRKARRHYGVCCNRSFDATKHSNQNRYWDDIEKEWKAENQISWSVTRGQNLPTKEPVMIKLYCTWHLDEGFPLSISEDVIFSDEDEAPHEFKLTAKTRPLCAITADLRNVPHRLFKKRMRGGARYRELNYEVGMKVESGGLVFDLRVDDTIYGTVRAKYE